MRILYVLEHYHPYIGGAEKLFQNVAESMAQKGHEVVVVTTRFDAELAKNEVHNGVKIYRVTCFNRFFFTFAALVKLMKLKSRFDFVHATTYNAAFPAWVYSKIKRTPGILTFHEVWGDLWFELPFMTSIERWGFFLYEKLVLKLPFDHYIAVSNFTADSLKTHGIPAHKVQRIYNGVEYPQSESTGPEKSKNPEFTLVYFGRLGVSKGLNLLIPAIHDLAEQDQKVHLHLVVPQQPRATLAKVKSLIDEGTGRESITIHHSLPRNTLNQLVTSSDAVVVPSYSEGFCFVAAEACALHTPVIHSGKGALREVVSGKNIRMSEMTITGMADAIVKAKKGEWKDEKLKKFELSSSIDQYIEFYSELIGA